MMYFVLKKTTHKKKSFDTSNRCFNSKLSKFQIELYLSQSSISSRMPSFNLWHSYVVNPDCTKQCFVVVIFSITSSTSSLSQQFAKSPLIAIILPVVTGGILTVTHLHKVLLFRPLSKDIRHFH